MEYKDIGEICRLCLKTLSMKYSLFSNDLHEKIVSLALVEINKEDGLPTFCCNDCLTLISNFYLFKQTILASNKTLQEMQLKGSSSVNLQELLKDSPDLFEVMCMKDEDTSDSNDRLTIATHLSCDAPKHETVSNSPTADNVAIKIEMVDVPSELLDNIMKAKTKNAAPSFECEQCSKTFPDKQTIQRHVKGHRTGKCPVCSAMFRKDNLKKHFQVHNSTREICEICGKIAKNKESMRGHMYYAHNSQLDKQITCEYCGKEFKRAAHYRAHVKTVHLNIRNHQCHLCGKKFYSVHTMNKHIRMTHQGFRPSTCQVCKKAFSSPYALKTHARQHTLELPYKCKYCRSGFRQKISLVTHLRSKHSVYSEKVEGKYEI